MTRLHSENPESKNPGATSAGAAIWRGLRREFGIAFGTAAVMTMFVNLGMLFVPIFDMILYDRVLTSKNMDTVAVLAIGCMLGMAIYGILEFLRSCLFITMGDRLARRLNIPTLKSAIAASLDGGTAAAAQAMRDLNELRLFVSGTACVIPLDLLWSPALFMVLFLLHPAYGVYALGCASLLFILSLLTDLGTRRHLAAGNAANIKTLNDLAGALRNVEVLDGMGMLPAVARRWQRSQAAAMESLARATRKVKVFATVTKICRLFMQAGIIAIGVILVLRNEASPGSMMGANLLIAKLLLPFDQLVTGWRQWSFAWAAWQRVAALLQRSADREQTVPESTGPGRLIVAGLGFTPQGAAQPVLDDVSFIVEPGEAICVVGRSGAGKSTLARLIVGVFSPSAGRILLDGQSTIAWEREDFGRLVGYVPQSIALLDGTISENIARMRDVGTEEVVAAATKAGIHEMIGRLPQGYSTYIGSMGFALSGGQRQRIALARALFGSPKLLVLDEPNANLDHEGEKMLVLAIRAAKQAGASVIIVSHRPAILDAVDKVLTLKNGRVESFLPVAAPQASVAPPSRAASVRLVPA
jgi:ATP-binding cassette subfamily C protein